MRLVVKDRVDIAVVVRHHIVLVSLEVVERHLDQLDRLLAVLPDIVAGKDIAQVVLLPLKREV